MSKCTPRDTFTPGWEHLLLGKRSLLSVRGQTMVRTGTIPLLLVVSRLVRLFSAGKKFSNCRSFLGVGTYVEVWGVAQGSSCLRGMTVVACRDAGFPKRYQRGSLVVV